MNFVQGRLDTFRSSSYSLHYRVVCLLSYRQTSKIQSELANNWCPSYRGVHLESLLRCTTLYELRSNNGSDYNIIEKLQSIMKIWRLSIFSSLSAPASPCLPHSFCPLVRLICVMFSGFSTQDNSPSTFLVHSDKWFKPITLTTCVICK